MKPTGLGCYLEMLYLGLLIDHDDDYNPLEEFGIRVYQWMISQPDFTTDRDANRNFALRAQGYGLATLHSDGFVSLTEAGAELARERLNRAFLIH